MIRNLVASGVFALLIAGFGCSGTATHAAGPDWLPKAPLLPEPAGQIIEVATTEQLFRAVDKIAPGGTILIQDGRYRLPSVLTIGVDGVTVRGASGDLTRSCWTAARAGMEN